jgi:hypothetical protein
MEVRTMRVLVLFGVLAATCLVPATAAARDVYLNGTKVDGLTGQTFERARVRFDARGNIHIDVEGVNVQVVQTEGRPGVSATPQAGNPPPRYRYFLEASQFRIGLAQYDIEVHINGRSAATFRGDRQGGAIEVTQYLRGGENVVLFVANKTGGPRQSTSRRDFFRVTLFKGTVQGDNALMSQALRSFERTAAHTASTAEEHRVRVE